MFKGRNILFPTLLALSIVLVACGDDDDDSNRSPIASAGPDQNYEYFDNVVLDASGSRDDGSIVSYSWSQIAGTTVSLDDPALEMPSFETPEVNDVLTFQLTVTDNNGATGTDTVDVTITVPEIYTVISANIFSNTLTAYDDIQVTNGDVAPSRTVTGVNTRINGPVAMSHNVESNSLFVANLFGDSVGFFEGTDSLDGDVVPIRVLEGAETLLNNPVDVWIDRVNNQLYVSSINTILVYDNADVIDGDVAPSRVIAGPSTTLNTELKFSMDTVNDRLYVSNKADGIVVFDDVSTLDGDVAPSRTISGANTGIVNSYGVWVDVTRDILYQGDFTSGPIRVFDNASTIDGDIAPSRTIENDLISNSGTVSIFLDEVYDTLYAAVYGANAILVFENASTLDGTVTPDISIVGGNTGLAGPAGIVGIR